MSDLKLAPGLTLPLDAATRRIAIMGGNDSGKTYCSTKLAELMLEQGVQIVALDPVGNWHGIRRDGKGKGFAIPVLGGLHGDIALDPGSGTLIADLVVDRGISVIIDVSQFDSDAAQQRFAKDFMARLYNRRKAKPSAMCIFIEECHEFIPQSDFGDKQMLHVFNRAVKLGRNFGLGFCFISQRPQDVNKKSLERSQCVFAFQMQGRNERKTMVDWLGADTQTNLNALLPKLPQGQPYCWSPGWLGIDRVVEKVFEKRSADVSKTPEVGEVSIASKPLTPIDLKALRDAMAQEVEEQKANDPKVLKTRITELEKQLEGKAPVRDENAIALAVDVAVRPLQKQLEDLELLTTETAGVAEEISQAFTKYIEQGHEIEHLLERIRVLLKARDTFNGMNRRDMVKQGLRDAIDAPEPRAMAPVQPKPAASPTPIGSNGKAKDVAETKQAVLDTLAELDATGIGQPGAHIVAAFVGYSINTNQFKSAMAELNRDGLIGRAHGKVILQEGGRALAAQPKAIRTRGEYLERLFAAIGKHNPIRVSVLRTLLETPGHRLARQEVAQRVGYSVNTNDFKNALSDLRGFGFIAIPNAGEVQLTEHFLPKGLK